MLLLLITLITMLLLAIMTLTTITLKIIQRIIDQLSMKMIDSTFLSYLIMTSNILPRMKTLPIPLLNLMLE